MKKIMTFLTVFVVAIVLSNSSPLYGNTSSVDSHVVIADANDVAVASSSGGDVNFTLMGFSSVPIVLEISAPLNPQILSDVQPLGESIPFGAYVGVQSAVELFAAGENGITEILSLDLL